MKIHAYLNVEIILIRKRDGGNPPGGLQGRDSRVQRLLRLNMRIIAVRWAKGMFFAMKRFSPVHPPTCVRFDGDPILFLTNVILRQGPWDIP